MFTACYPWLEREDDKRVILLEVRLEKAFRNTIPPELLHETVV